MNRLADRYEIVRELGRGGMATVYVADDTKYGRQVAIKVLRPDVARSIGAERFLREITIAARLSHPHIVPLVDSGEADGVLYYVSPYLRGGSLRDRLDREQRLPVADALRIAHEVASGLDYVHRSGFVHRDVKPANILFADGLALLADFGVAHAYREHGFESLTDGGIAVGTPAYMSPEQASGETELENRSDEYSLACVVFEMLAGEPPFAGTGARATMARQVTEAARSVRVLRPEVPLALDQALCKALGKDPAERYTSTVEFAEAMEAPTERGRGRGARTRTIAVLPFVNTSSDPEMEYFSDGMTDELIDALSKVDGLRVASRTSVFALKGKPQDVRSIGELLGVSVVLEGTVRTDGDRMRITAQLTSTDDGRLLWSQRYDRGAGMVFAVQDELARTIVDTLRTTSFADLTEPAPPRRTASTKAYTLYLRGRYAWNKRTREGVEEGIRYFEAAIAEDPGYAAAYTGLADSYALEGDYRSTPVVEGFGKAKAYARRAIALDDTLAEAHASLAWSLFIYDWNWAEAEREFRRAIALDSQYASAHNWYAFLLIARGHVEEALVEGHIALELNPSSVSIRRSIGHMYLYARRYDQAEHHLLRAVAMNPESEETQRVLGLTLAQMSRFDEAERTLREAMELPGAGTYTLATLGYALALAGKRADAEAVLGQLEVIGRHEYVSPVSFATLHLGLGNSPEALDWLERAYADRRGWLAYLAANPIFDRLRGEQRFMALVERLGL
jgi:serine/threonine protein kinase/Tfp pilus assembly protein PilF